MRKPRSEMIAETRAKLLAAGRQAFGTVGYADASMDDFTGAAGLTRGALYHHFGDKKGLLQAVISQIDAEMTDRLCAISSQAETPWQGFVDENVAYVQMALEPEIQRIMFRDGPAVLGDPSGWPNANGCIATVARSLADLALLSMSTRKLAHVSSMRQAAVQHNGSPMQTIRRSYRKKLSRHFVFSLKGCF
jgi:AcrR family transcriptional regulator